ncbi:MAG: TIGR01906 family membrane protein [Firmicutes bacterium]|jgi:integral membrane protein (TIGR01906 family)|nr:TIGR01906 family membrane protein [Bacillota bacterium]MBR3033897.1 TIGR01906 family membrane protein [Bacillota bacterium]MBR3748974.1 TIGR01906 family membrane protein [Bacillota bacterium]MBR6969874.1 TIGR01906 family membrane protein [Bacillota bacterium]
MKSRILSIFIALLLALFAVSASVAAPILCRPFYYAHIDALRMPEKTGWTHEQIREAFDDVMDFLLKDAEFQTGDLAWSESGKSHFADCKVLFRLDLWLFVLTGAALLVLFLLFRHKKTQPARLAGRGPSFWAGTGILACFGGFGLFAASDFDRAFTLFHKVFFPGKTNWVFDARTDQVILVMPETFFRNCAILIGVLLAVFVILYILLGSKRKDKNV